LEIPIFIYGVFPSKKREEFISKRNVRVIKEFLGKREKLEIAKEEELAHLKQLRKKRSINRAIYSRLKRVMILTHEQKGKALRWANPPLVLTVNQPKMINN
jgi:hypothetical protein